MGPPASTKQQPRANRTPTSSDADERPPAQRGGGKPVPIPRRRKEEGAGVGHEQLLPTPPRSNNNDQVPPAGCEEAAGGSAAPRAQQIVHDVLAPLGDNDNHTANNEVSPSAIPEEVLPTIIPLGISNNAKNNDNDSVGINATADNNNAAPVSAIHNSSRSGDSSGNLNSEMPSAGPIVLRKHKIWAGTFLLTVVVVVAVAVIMSGGDSSSSSSSSIRDGSPAFISSSTTTTPPPMPPPSTVKPDSEIKLTASDGKADDRFGSSVAINGNTMVIGAYWDDTENGTNSGSAYVYTHSGTVWTEQVKLTASEGTEYNEFGRSVAINGDTIVIGAYTDDTESGVRSGSTYVYTRSGTMWTEQAKLTANDGGQYDWFGWSVAISEDTIVVGAIFDSPENDIWSGSAYVYTHSGTVWTEQAKLTASDGAMDDKFGIVAAINGDTIVIGASRGDRENVIDSGSAYVYTRSGSVWTEQTKLSASDGSEGDGFGASVAINRGTIVIGAYQDDTESGVHSGSAYVYTRSGTIWTEHAKLMASDSAADDQFGDSVAIDGNIIVIGTPNDDTEDGIDSGSAYVYIFTETSWTEQAKLNASDGAAQDWFGRSVAINGYTIVIGAGYSDMESATDAGSVYIFE